MKKILRMGCIFVLIAVLLTAVVSCVEKADPTLPPQEEKMKSPEEALRELEGDHSFSYTVTVEPTESSVGEGTAYCADCGLTTSVFFPVLSEREYTLETKRATCTEDGWRKYTSKYGEFVVKEGMFGHSYETTTVPATCTHDGYERKRCIRCGKETETVLLQTEHTYEQTDRIEGTCTTYGYTTYECSVCGDVFVRYDTAYKHTFDEGVRHDVSCNTEEKYGYTLYTCEKCGETKTVRDESPAHIYNKDTGKCDVCGEKCEHDFVGYVCSVCGLDIEERVREEGYFLLDENGNEQADVGEKVYFGTYPQRIASKEERAILQESEPNEKGRYELNGKEFVKKPLDQKRKALKKFSNGETVASYAEYEDIDHVYENYFYCVEPICWTVAATGEEGVTLRACAVLGVVEYRAKGTTVTVGTDVFAAEEGVATEKHANDWSVSDLRAFLNGTFFETAFEETQKTFVVSHETENGKETNYYREDYAEDEDTEDYVFIDAYSEIFGEEETPSDYSEERMKECTDYALGSGLYAENDHYPYYTRSVGNATNKATYVDTEGKLVTDAPLYFTVGTSGERENGIGFLPLITVLLP